MSEFPEQTGLADAWFSDKGDHLAVAGSGSVQCLPEGVEFSGAPDEASKSARRGGLQPRTYRTQRR